MENQPTAQPVGVKRPADTAPAPDANKKKSAPSSLDLFNALATIARLNAELKYILITHYRQGDEMHQVIVPVSAAPAAVQKRLQESEHKNSHNIYLAPDDYSLLGLAEEDDATAVCEFLCESITNNNNNIDTRMYLLPLVAYTISIVRDF